MATLLKKQKPIAWCGSAWCPGGLKQENAFDAFLFMTASTAAIAPPADLKAACHV